MVIATIAILVGAGTTVSQKTNSAVSVTDSASSTVTTASIPVGGA